MSKRTKIIIAVVVLVVIAGAAGAFALRAGGSGPEIETATVAETNLGVTVSASGKIQAGSRADMYPPTAGTLAVVYVSDGATVTAGQKIAKMDTGPLELAVKQAKAGLDAGTGRVRQRRRPRRVVSRRHGGEGECDGVEEGVGVGEEGRCCGRGAD